MICKNPYVVEAGHAVGCGQCLPCRINKRRQWAHRIMLEASQYTDNSFVTLTYDDTNIPEGGSLVHTDYQRWLKRLRKRLFPQTVRYFIVGEYGERTQRPHYHAALFGYPVCERYPQMCKGRRCPVCSVISDTWGLGLVQVGTLTPASASYIANYVTKKWVKGEDPTGQGRVPEFAQMSRMPGLGAGFMHDLASTVMEHDLVKTEGDVPTALRHGPKLMPLGRYLVRRLRKLTGNPEEAPDITKAKYLEKMQPMHEAAEEATRYVKGQKSGLYKSNFRHRLIAAAEGKITQLEARNRLYGPKGTL